MNTTWRTHLTVVIFRWLWGQLRLEGTRQWLLNVSLRALRDWLIQSSVEGGRVWVEVFEESDRLHRLERCRQLLDALASLRRKHVITPLVIYFRAKLDHRRGYLRRAERGYHRILLSRSLDVNLRAYTLESWARLNFEQGRLLLSERLFQMAAKKWRQIGSITGLSSSFAQLALLHRRRSDWNSSIIYSRKVLSLVGAPSNSTQAHIVGEVLLGLNIILRIQGQFQQAAYFLEQADFIFHRAHDFMGIALVQNQKARMALWSDLPTQGFHDAHAALATLVSLQASFEEGLALRTLGELHLARGDLDTAGRYFQASLRIYQRQKNPYLEGILLTHVADVERRRSNLTTARRYLTQALHAEAASGDELAVGWTLKQMGLVEAMQGRITQAILSLERSLAVLKRYQNRPQVAVVLEHLAGLYQQQGFPQKAANSLKRVRRLRQQQEMG